MEHSITRRDDSNDYIDSLAWTEDNVVQTNDLVAQRFLLEYRRARYSKYLVPPLPSLFSPKFILVLTNLSIIRKLPVYISTSTNTCTLSEVVSESIV